MKVLRGMPLRRTPWVDAEAACGRLKLDPKDTFQGESLENPKAKISTTRNMSEIRGDVRKYVRRTRDCLPEEPLRSTHKPRAGDADSTYKKSFRRDGLKSKKNAFRMLSKLNGATDAKEREITCRQKIPPICGRVSAGQSRPVKTKMAPMHNHRAWNRKICL